MATGRYLRQIHIDVTFDHRIRLWMGNMPSQIPPTPETPAPPEQNDDEWLAMGHLHYTGAAAPGAYAADGYPGRIYKLTLDGKVLGVLDRIGHGPGEFGWIHDLAGPSENVLFAAELLN